MNGYGWIQSRSTGQRRVRRSKYVLNVKGKQKTKKAGKEPKSGFLDFLSSKYSQLEKITKSKP
jgi:hypothetical protein